MDGIKAAEPLMVYWQMPGEPQNLPEHSASHCVSNVTPSAQTGE